MKSISEPKSYPVSAYLSPRAYNALEKFHRGSLYGSMSRTIEEIILAFVDIYSLATTLEKAREEGKSLTPEAKDWIITQMERAATGRLQAAKQ